MRPAFKTVIHVVAITALMTSLGRGAEFPEGKTLPVWPNGPEEGNGLSGAESTAFCVGNISTATMTVYLPPREKATGAAVVITPGGGYGAVCLKSEGTDIARILIDRGIAAVVLKYRLPNGHFKIPGADTRRTIRTTRHHAGEWGIDPNKIGVWGFSAGGHLASTVATVFDKGNPDAEDLIERQSCRPDFRKRGTRPHSLHPKPFLGRGT